MKPDRVVFSVTGFAFLFAVSSALAQFSGYFGGYYAPAGWTRYVYNNPSFQDTAFVYTGNVPNSLEIDGAVSAQQQTGNPQLPVSIIDYTIVLNGSGLQPVAFLYSFTGTADGYDAADLIYDSGSGLQVVAGLSTLLNGTTKSYSTTLQGGRSFGFRVYSNNDSAPDVLIISPIPEPSTSALLGLGAVALLLRRARRLS